MAKGTFGQTSSGVVRGTFEVPAEYGDYRFLAGNLHGTTLRLSTFNGQQATLVTAEVLPDGTTMQGEVVTSGNDVEQFIAERVDTITLDDPLARVTVTSPDGRMGFERLEESPYDGHPTIVEIFGTWCVNCADLTPVLVDLYRDHHDDGLEMLSVAYEGIPDRAYREERVAAYRAKHEVEWEILLPDATRRPRNRRGTGAIHHRGRARHSFPESRRHRPRDLQRLFRPRYRCGPFAGQSRVSAPHQRDPTERVARRQVWARCPHPPLVRQAADCCRTYNSVSSPWLLHRGRRAPASRFHPLRVKQKNHGEIEDNADTEEPARVYRSDRGRAKTEGQSCHPQANEEGHREKAGAVSTNIVGFGRYHYKYASGREGDWFVTGFSPRKQALTLYIMSGFTGEEALLEAVRG